MCGKANHYHQVQIQFEVDYIDMQSKSDCNYKFIIVYQVNSHFMLPEDHYQQVCHETILPSEWRPHIALQ